MRCRAGAAGKPFQHRYSWSSLNFGVVSMPSKNWIWEVKVITLLPLLEFEPEIGLSCCVLNIRYRKCSTMHSLRKMMQLKTEFVKESQTLILG